jgi:hypothetical protein
MMRTDPGTDLLTEMPGGMVPPPHQDPFPLSGQLLAEPGEGGSRDMAYWEAVYTSEQGLVGMGSKPRRRPAHGCGGMDCKAHALGGTTQLAGDMGGALAACTGQQYLEPPQG